MRAYAFITVTFLLLLIGCTGNDKHPNPSGTLEATEVEISAELSARILEVRSDIGTTVRAGDTLVVLDMRLIQLQKAQTEASRGSIIAQQSVASDAVQQAKKNLELTETTLKRTESLLEQGSATQQQIDELRTRRDTAKLQSASAQHQLESLKAEELKLDAALEVFDRQLEMGAIIAPTNGTVLLRNAEPGEVALPGQTLLKLGDLDHMELRVFLSSTDLNQVKIGQEFPVTVDALEGTTIKGVVTWISSEAEFTPKNAQTRDARVQLVYAVKLSLGNPEGRLAIGMPAEVVLQ